MSSDRAQPHAGLMASDDQMDLFNLAGMAPVAETAPPPDFNPDRIPTDVKVPIPPGTYSSMEQISQHCNRCHRCELGENRTNAVVGRGNVKAPILIVGEGPGQTEDETGQAFVGKAGQLLDKILASVQITEADIFISNIVKCRPPGNRTPTVQEMDACRPYLMEQIRMIDPKIILLLGAASVRGITGDKRGITKIRGQWLEWDNRLCMPMLHPAYLLRNPSRDKGSPKWLTWQDIQTVRSKLDEIRQSS